MPDARGGHGELADPGVNGLMPIVEVALSHKGKKMTEGRTSITWTLDARTGTRSTLAAAATAGGGIAG